MSFDPAIAALVEDYVNYICPVKGADKAMETLDPEVAKNPLIFPTKEMLANGEDKGTVAGVAWALAGGFMVYGVIRKFVGLRLDAEQEFEGADLSIHKIGSTPDREVSW